MPDVVMPRLSDSMEEGTILRWLRGDGEEVKRGDELVEIETDKATMTYEADTDGVLRLVAGEGDTLPVGELIATIGEAAGGDPHRGAGGAAPAATPVPSPSGAPAPAGAGTGGGADAAATTAAPAPAVANGAPPSPAASPDGGDGRVKASPVARRIARERGVELAAVRGTGPGGRIVKADVEAAASAAPPAAAPAAAPVAAPGAPAAAPAPAAPPPAVPPPPVTTAEKGTAKGDVSVQELSRTQALIARRMAESKATVPHFTLQAEIDMEGCVELRGELKDVAGEGRPVPSFNDMVVKACAHALREHPRANGSYRDGRFELFSRVNVGVAVAAQDALVVPTLFDADRKTLGQIAAEARALAERVRAGVVTPPELSGGTFTVSNLGMYGIRTFTAVINPPQAAILAVGELAPRAVVREGEVVVRSMLDVTLACDHRILYGADAANFLGRIRELLERPLALAL